MKSLMHTFLLSTLLGMCLNVNAITASPQNWWVGMQSKQLQIMLHEPNVAKQQWQLEPHAGVELTSTTRTDNQNYTFLNLEIKPSAKPGVLLFSSKSGERFEYSLLARKAKSSQRNGFNSSDTIYLINPDRFANGDTSNDTVQGMLEAANPQERGGRHGGDIQGIIDALPYLQKLGVTQLWLTPPLENDMPSYSYHGYAITDFYNIDPRMGSNELYRELSAKAKQHGIGMVMDLVLNHFGSEHEWMTDKPTADWINFNGDFANGKHATSHARQTIQDPHASEFDKRQFSDGWFVATMPDLNQRQPLLATYLIQNAIWWIEYADLSGIRVDTYSYSDKAFLADWTKAIMTEYPDFNIVGEEWTSNPAIASYWQAGKVNNDGYTSSLPSVMDFSLQEALIQALNEDESWNTGWVKVYQSIANDFLYPNPDNLLVFADNHDMSRVFTELEQDLDKTKMAMAMLLTTRGIAQMYYGTEVLLDNTGSNDHGDIRIDFPGGFKGQPSNAFTGQGLSDEQRDMQQAITTLLNFRKQSPAIAHGKLTHFSPKAGIYSYARISDQQTVLVFLNKNSAAKSWSLAYMQEVIGQHKQAINLFTNQAISLIDTVTLAPKSATVLIIE
ncbi:MAG: glycoside hydrolase family 13 protein [Pseudoalteromonas prydzensis]|uniref:glycoside hydrolase family 13 protein n=1 Tax=Pseudoalteromonas prydzensis TaxID=182141 RepID=UPI003F988D48